jgi:hypothetical protein
VYIAFAVETGNTDKAELQLQFLLYFFHGREENYGGRWGWGRGDFNHTIHLQENFDKRDKEKHR